MIAAKNYGDTDTIEDYGLELLKIEKLILFQ